MFCYFQKEVHILKFSLSLILEGLLRSLSFVTFPFQTVCFDNAPHLTSIRKEIMRYVMVEKVPSERSAITERKTGNGEKKCDCFYCIFFIDAFQYSSLCFSPY